MTILTGWLDPFAINKIDGRIVAIRISNEEEGREIGIEQIKNREELRKPHGHLLGSCGIFIDNMVAKYLRKNGYYAII